MGRVVHPHIITPDSALGGKDIARSLRFDHNANCFLTRTPSSTGNRRTWTFSVWMKHCLINSGRANTFFCSGTNNPDTIIKIDNDRFEISRYGGSGYQTRVTSKNLLRDPNSWYHFVGAVDTTQATSSNRVKLYINGTQVTEFDNSSYPSQNYEYPEMNNSGTPNYIGRHGHPTSQNFDGYMAEFNFIDGAQLTPDNFGYTDPLTGIWRPKEFKFSSDIPNRKGRNFSSTWTASGNGFGSYPITRAYDGDISTNANNSAGGQILTWNTSTYNLSGNLRIYGRGDAYDVYVNGNATKVADMPSSNGWVDCGTHAEINEIQFAGTTYNTANGLGSAGIHLNAFIVGGVWLRDDFPTFGTNGFYLDFSDNSGATATTIGKDRSGNNNNYAPTNISVSSGNNNDSMIDTPIDNFITLNPLRRQVHNCVLSNGNLKATGPNESYPGATGNIALSSGKWYYEFEIQTYNSPGSDPMVGICRNSYISGGAGRIVYRAGGHYITATPSEPSDPASFAVGDIIGVALDLDDAAGKIRFYKNGTLQPVLANGDLDDVKSDLSISTLGGVFPYVQMYHNDVCTINFGQTPFIHTPPSGHKKITSNNLLKHSLPSIINPKKHFETLTYTGNGATNNITSLEFQPDFVWIKAREDAHHHTLHDSVRGPNKQLYSTRNDIAEYNESAGLNQFLHNGLGFNGNNYYSVNVNGANFVAWCWKGGGSSGTYNIDGVGYATAAAAGLNGGTITPTGTSINTISGLSIIAYTGNGTGGASMSHGLPSAPKIMFHRSRGQGRNWYTITTALDGSADYWYLNNTNSPGNSAVTAPTSDLMYFTSSQESNNNGENYIVYAFCDIPGFLKMGTYAGNASTDGTYIHLGFRPAWIMIRKSSGSEDWVIYDNKRDVDNIVGFRIYADIPNAAASNAVDLDFLSDGFKHRKTSGLTNASATYFYMAFAEQSGRTPYMAPSNAR
jgi:hypothetical protein